MLRAKQPTSRRQARIPVPTHNFPNGDCFSKASYGDNCHLPPNSARSSASSYSSISSYERQISRQNSGSTNITYSTDASSIWTPSGSASESDVSFCNRTPSSGGPLDSYVARSHRPTITGNSAFDACQSSDSYNRLQRSPLTTDSNTRLYDEPESIDFSLPINAGNNDRQPCRCHGLSQRPNFEPVSISGVEDACASRLFQFECGKYLQYNLLDKLVQSFKVVVDHVTQLIGRLPQHLAGPLNDLSAGATIGAGLTALEHLQSDPPTQDQYQLFSLICLTQAGLLLGSKRCNKASYTDALFLDIVCWFDYAPSSPVTEAVFLLAQLLWLPLATKRLLPNGQTLFCPRTTERTEAGNLKATAFVCQSHVDVMHLVAHRHTCPSLRENARTADPVSKVKWLKDFVMQYLSDELAVCPQCPRTFTGNANDQSTNLKRHLQTACERTKSDASYRKFECKVCGKSFTRCDNLKEHSYSIHKRQRRC